MRKQKNPVQPEDLSGKKFNRWLVIDRAPDSENGKKRCIMWNALCDCGTKRAVQAGGLRNGGSKSCGCLTIETSRKKLGEGNFNSIYYYYSTRAKKSNRNFELSKEQFKQITSSNCYYCNIAPFNTTKTQTGGIYGYYVYNGIDRINNALGYTIKNSVPCCKFCNYAKHKMSLDEFKNWLIRVSENLDNFVKKEKYE